VARGRAGKRLSGVCEREPLFQVKKSGLWLGVLRKAQLWILQVQELQEDKRGNSGDTVQNAPGIKMVCFHLFIHLSFFPNQ
jgi:hypothetical protein